MTMVDVFLTAAGVMASKTVEITAMKMDVVCVVMYTAYLHTCIMPGAYEPHEGRPLGGS